VEDAEQPRGRAVDAARRRLEGGLAGIVERDREQRLAPRRPDRLERRGFGLVAVVGQCQPADRLAQLAQAGGVRIRDAICRTDQLLRPQPLLSLLRGAESIPVVREVVVVGVEEALEQLEPAGGLGPPSGFELLADQSPVSILDLTSIMFLSV
jgi:hypothetical protein